MKSLWRQTSSPDKIRLTTLLTVSDAAHPELNLKRRYTLLAQGKKKSVQTILNKVPKDNTFRDMAHFLNACIAYNEEMQLLENKSIALANISLSELRPQLSLSQRLKISIKEIVVNAVIAMTQNALSDTSAESHDMELYHQRLIEFSSEEGEIWTPFCLDTEELKKLARTPVAFLDWQRQLITVKTAQSQLASKCQDLGSDIDLTELTEMSRESIHNAIDIRIFAR